jgi:hypothetical protein
MVYEVKIEDLANLGQNCSHCHQPFVRLERDKPRHVQPLADLADLAERFKSFQSAFEVEFVLPDTD